MTTITTRVSRGDREQDIGHITVDDTEIIAYRHVEPDGSITLVVEVDEAPNCCRIYADDHLIWERRLSLMEES